jgi:hypothetical protein
MWDCLCYRNNSHFRHKFSNSRCVYCPNSYQIYSKLNDTSQRSAVLHRLSHMGNLGAFRASQVGNRTRYLQSAMCGAGGPAQAGGGDVEKLGRRVVQQHMGVDVYALQSMVGLFLTG